MDDNTLTVSEVMKKYNWCRTTIQQYLKRYEGFKSSSKIVFGRRIFDKDKLEVWYKEMTTI